MSSIHEMQCQFLAPCFFYSFHLKWSSHWSEIWEQHEIKGLAGTKWFLCQDVHPFRNITLIVCHPLSNFFSTFGSSGRGVVGTSGDIYMGGVCITWQNCGILNDLGTWSLCSHASAATVREIRTTRQKAEKKGWARGFRSWGDFFLCPGENKCSKKSLSFFTL